MAERQGRRLQALTAARSLGGGAAVIINGKWLCGELMVVFVIHHPFLGS